ncbi:hypothetical protein [Acinetobacter pittii]|uniref:hypothetical protein n=1 Tax=Acinetobacter pittii TaxID=48296 RepID=UPI001D096F88|nr:hypothetical protein [Acinetobacter pittii]
MKPEQFIRDLGVEKARQVVEGAPEGATHFVLWTGKVRYINLSKKEVYLDSSNEWLPANIMVLNIVNPLDELELAIKDHESIYGGGDE